MDDELDKACAELEAARALCEVPSASAEIFDDNLTLTPPTNTSLKSGQGLLTQTAVTPLPFPIFKDEDERAIVSSNETVADQGTSGCIRCEELEKELDQMKKFYDGVSKVNEELQLALKELSLAKDFAEQEAARVNLQLQEAKEEIRILKQQHSRQDESENSSVSKFQPDSRTFEAKWKDAQNEIRILKTKLAESNSKNYDNDTTAEIYELKLKIKSAQDELEYLREKLKESNRSSQLKQKLENDLQESQQNFIKMKSFYEQEKELSTRIQQTAKKVMHGKIMLEDKIIHLENELKEADMENKKLQLRLEHYIRISDADQNSEKIRQEPIQGQVFHIPDYLTDIAGNDNGEMHNHSDPFKNLHVDESYILDSQLSENQPLENYGRNSLIMHDEDGNDTFNRTFSTEGGQITRLHINSATGVIDINMSPSQASPSRSLARQEMSKIKSTSSPSPSSRLQKLSKSLAAEIEESVLISSEIKRNLEDA